MPKVNGKSYPYTPKGIKEAKKHSGKGTRSRLNTAAEKNMFNSKLSK